MSFGSGGGAHAHSAALVEPPLPDAPIVEEIASARRADRWRRRLIFAVVWIVLVGGLGLFLWNAGRVDAEFIVKSGPFILGGIWITILVSVLSIMLATVLAIVGALGRLSANPVTYAIATLYVSLVRGTPLLVQIFFVYFALPQAGHRPPADPGRHPRPRLQLRRVHDRDLPGRHPGRAAWPARGGAGARHAGVAHVCAGSCCPRPSGS